MDFRVGNGYDVHQLAEGTADVHTGDIPLSGLVDQAFLLGDRLDFLAGHRLAVLLVEFLELFLALVVVARFVVEDPVLRDVPEFDAESHVLCDFKRVETFLPV